MDSADLASGKSNKTTTTNNTKTSGRETPPPSLEHPEKEDSLFPDSPPGNNQQIKNTQDPSMDSDFEEDSVDKLSVEEDREYGGRTELITMSPPDGLGIKKEFLDLLVKQMC